MSSTDVRRLNDLKRGQNWRAREGASSLQSGHTPAGVTVYADIDVVVRVAPGYCCGVLNVFCEILHRNETTCEVVNPRFRNLFCKTNKIGMPRVERGSLATSSCSGSSRPFGICRGTRQADTDNLHLVTPPRLGHMATVTSMASLKQSYS